MPTPVNLRIANLRVWQAIVFRVFSHARRRCAIFWPERQEPLPLYLDSIGPPCSWHGHLGHLGRADCFRFHHGAHGQDGRATQMTPLGRWSSALDVPATAAPPSSINESPCRPTSAVGTF